MLSVASTRKQKKKNHWGTEMQDKNILPRSHAKQRSMEGLGSGVIVSAEKRREKAGQRILGRRK